MKDPLARLEAQASRDARKMLAAMRRGILRVRGLVATAKNQGQARAREKLFREICAAYAELGGDLDEILKDGATDAATLAADTARDSILAAGPRDVAKFDLERAREYWSYIHPANGASLAAVFTDKMSRDLVDTLRRSLVGVMREAAINGWTMDEIRKGVEDRWAEISKNDSNFKFVDRAGRAWDNGRYAQMLARTTATRVYNDCYLDRMAENGFALVRISSQGAEPDCDVCREWEGRICSIDGKDRRFPSVEDARLAGVFHPNCMCTWEYVDELADEGEIARQAEANAKDGEEEQLRDAAKVIETTGKPTGKTITLKPISAFTAKEIAVVCGVAPKNLSPTVSDKEIRHSFIRHGKHIDGLTRGETQKNQVPITPEDIARIPEILAEYDKIEPGSDGNRLHLKSVRFVKSYSDGTSCAVLLVGDNLQFQTMWKWKK